jgi:pimeloyl-ACP methyl ester carboxylesterase
MKRLLSFVVLASLTAAASAQDVSVPDAFFDSAGVRIRYVDQGQGPPVVLIHGYTGTLERHWVNPGVVAGLVKDHRVIALDCRGHGKSGKPADPKTYGPEMAQDIVRLLDHLKIARAHIVGFSMGAIIAGHMLTTNPDRFSSVTFVAYHPVHRWTAADDEEAEASARDLESGTPFKSLILGVWPKEKPAPNEEEIRKLSQTLAAANDTKALAAYNRSRRALVVTDAQMAAVKVPAFAIIGSADPGLAGVHTLAKVMPAMKVLVVEGAEHGGERGVLRRSEFLSALREFLQKQR